jgi:hypothetical protein
MQNSPTDEIPAAAAAERLNVSEQTVRNWARAGKLNGRQTATKRWLITTASVDAVLSVAAGPLRESTTPTVPPAPGAITPVPSTNTETLERRLDEATAILKDLQGRDLAAEQLVWAVEQDRDRFRAEAVALRDAALQLASAAHETDAGVRHLLEVLERQREALVQLLTPGSPQDLMPGSS